MSKRKAADGNLEEEEGSRETKRPKLDDLRPASVQVWMSRSLVGSKIAPFLRTAEVNNLLLTCKLQRGNLDTNPNAWSPALQLNKPTDISGISLKDDQVARFYSKISPNLRALDINLSSIPEPTWDIAGMCSHIAVAVKKPLEVLRLTSTREHPGTWVDIETWHLFANSIVFRGTSFNHLTEADENKAEHGLDLTAPDYVHELDCTLDEYHRHSEVLHANNNIFSLKINADVNADYKCKFCGATRLARHCNVYRNAVLRLHIQLGKRFNYETSVDHFKIEELAAKMEGLQSLTLSGKTDRPSEWIQESIREIRRTHPNGKDMEIDCSKLEVVKVVEPQFVPFVLP